jgi:hypothetical protein
MLFENWTEGPIIALSLCVLNCLQIHYHLIITLIVKRNKKNYKCGIVVLCAFICERDHFRACGGQFLFTSSRFNGSNESYCTAGKRHELFLHILN